MTSDDQLVQKQLLDLLARIKEIRMLELSLSDLEKEDDGPDGLKSHVRAYKELRSMVAGNIDNLAEDHDQYQAMFLMTTDLEKGLQSFSE